MKRMLAFTKRNLKELIRDPLTLAFMVILPLFIFLLMIFLANKMNIPNTNFQIQNFLPSTIIFSFSFITLFSAMLISKDRASSFLTRLLSSPLKARDYIIGYTIPLALLALIPNLILIITSVAMGLQITVYLLLAILATIPVSLIFSGLGLLLGSLLSEKPSLLLSNILIQVNAFTSGMWFDLNAIGGGYKIISYILPFSHCVDLVKGLLNNNFDGLWINFVVVIAYALVINILAIFAFRHKMKHQ